ncbi:MAG: DUF4262 domain-containing protein [Acidimicrobiia bacterium]
MRESLVEASIRAAIDQKNARLTQAIRANGWMIQYVGGEGCDRTGCDCATSDEPPFAYTVGLFGMGHPELLIFGVSIDDAMSILSELCDRIRGGDQLVPNVPIRFGHHQLIPEEVPNPGDIVFIANDFYQRPAEVSVSVLQLTYDDERGRFPWDDGCTVAHLQPRPGTFDART